MISASRRSSRPRPRTRLPQQARSSATYRRLLDAAERLLQEKSFDALTVAEVTARAGVTIGAFYARFADKEALLEALEERLTETVLAVLRRATDPHRWAGLTVAEALRQYLRELVQAYLATRGAGRALVLRSHTDPGLKGRLRRLNTEGPPLVLKLLLQRGGIRHPRPKLALETALLAVRSTLRETLLFGETWPGKRPVSPELLAEELTRLFLGYLGLDGRAGSRVV